MWRMVTLEYVVLVLLTGAAGLLALVVVTTLYVCYRGPRRAALSPTAALLALVAPLCGIGGACKYLTSEFAKIAFGDVGIQRELPAACGHAQDLMGLGVLLGVVTLLLSAAMSFWPQRGVAHEGRFPVSAVRSIVVLVLPIVPWAMTLFVHEYVRTANRMAVAVMETPTKPAENEPTTDEEARPSASASIAAVSSRIGRGMTVGIFSPLVGLLVVAGFAAASAILVWRADVGPVFQTIGTLLLVAGALLAAFGMLLFERRVDLPF